MGAPSKHAGWGTTECRPLIMEGRGASHGPRRRLIAVFAPGFRSPLTLRVGAPRLARPRRRCDLRSRSYPNMDPPRGSCELYLRISGNAWRCDDSSRAAVLCEPARDFDWAFVRSLPGGFAACLTGASEVLAKQTGLRDAYARTAAAHSLIACPHCPSPWASSGARRLHCFERRVPETAGRCHAVWRRKGALMSQRRDAKTMALQSTVRRRLKRRWPRLANKEVRDQSAPAASLLTLLREPRELFHPFRLWGPEV